jgi:nicotinamide mononucleotide transporter
MPERWLDTLALALAAMSAWEAVAVLLAVAYLLLAVRQNPWCWAAAFASTAIFTALFWQVQLVMQSALNVYYMAMAIYGWWCWQHGGNDDDGLPVVRWSWAQHALVIAVIALAALVSGWLLARHGSAARPYLDSLITWGAVVTTFMVARKVLENWAYWMMFNALAIFLFLDRAMLLTASLHASYLVISVFGWVSWRREYLQQNLPSRESSQ